NADGSFRGGLKTYDTPTSFQRKLEKDLRYLVRERLSGAVSRVLSVTTPSWSGSPYLGLRPFTSEEASIFCGRGREVDALIERLRDTSHRFLTVVGTSGTGKS